jgi:hypothetical protein
MFPLCVYEEARKYQGHCLLSFAALFPTHTRSGRECAGDECGHMGWPNHYSGQNFGLDIACKSSMGMPNSAACLRT